MASSNRHWPSMFKSKPCNTTSHHHQWQHHDINSSLLSTGTCHRSPYAAGCEERSPEPKPRWNPKPEQIRILEAIFNSGMVNPPRDEIRKIRAQLQEYGQVGDANVFYWFQNRKSRSKHKQRHLQNASKSQNQHQQQPPAISTAPTTSSSSSSDKSMDKAFSLLNSPTASVNQQPYFGSHHGDQFLQEPYFFQPNVGSTNGTTTITGGGFSQGLCFSELGSVIHGNHDQTVGNCSGLLLTELMMMNNHGIIPKNSTPTPTKADEEKMKMHEQMNNYTAPPSTSTVHSILPPTTTVTVPSTINHTQGAGNGGLGSVRSTVFINDVQIEVGVGPINLRDTFDDEYVLVHATGQPVLTNDWGVTLQPLQHGASYYLVPRTLATSPLSTIDLI